MFLWLDLPNAQALFVLFCYLPKTDISHIPFSIFSSGVVKLLQPSSEFGAEAREIGQNFNQPRRGTDCGDHPPITPMKLMCKISNPLFNFKHFIITRNKNEL